MTVRSAWLTARYARTSSPMKFTIFILFTAAYFYFSYLSMPPKSSSHHHSTSNDQHQNNGMNNDVNDKKIVKYKLNNYINNILIYFHESYRKQLSICHDDIVHKRNRYKKMCQHF